MSNIGKQPIMIHEGTSVKTENNTVFVSGPKGNLEWELPDGIEAEINEGVIKIKKKRDLSQLEKFYGLSRALIANMIEGVSKGFEKKLELSGVGYRARLDGRDLVLNVGFAHSVKITPPEEIAIQVKDNIITVSGINKQIVGDVASKIRRIRPPDPYKAKGIKYEGEHIRRKAGKAAKTSEA